MIHDFLYGQILKSSNLTNATEPRTHVLPSGGVMLYSFRIDQSTCNDYQKHDYLCSHNKDNIGDDLVKSPIEC